MAQGGSTLGRNTIVGKHLLVKEEDDDVGRSRRQIGLPLYFHELSQYNTFVSCGPENSKAISVWRCHLATVLDENARKLLPRRPGPFLAIFCSLIPPQKRERLETKVSGFLKPIF